MILVTGNGTLAKELVKLSTTETSIVSLSRKTMDITDEYVVSDVIKKYMMTPDKPKYLTEETPLKPSNNYGWSKLGGECVTQLISDSLILRCALCDIPFRHSVAFTDVYRNSITHKDIAPLILKLKDEIGIINLASDTKTVYDFVSQYQEINKGSGKDIAPSLKLSTQKLKELLGE